MLVFSASQFTATDTGFLDLKATFNDRANLFKFRRLRILRHLVTRNSVPRVGVLYSGGQ